MKCIYCNNEDIKENNSIRRRRECSKCGRRFTTYEVVEESPVLVIKSNGNREKFDTQKLKIGIMKACDKRPVSMQQIDALVNDIEKKVYNTFEEEIKDLNENDVIDLLSKKVIAEYEDKLKDIPEEVSNEFEKVINDK